MKRNTRTLTALAIMALILTVPIGVGMFAAPVSAQDSDPGENSVADALFTDEDEDEDGDTGGIGNLPDFVSGLVARYSPLTDRPEKADADEYATDLKTTFNQNNETLLNWTNSRVTVDKDTPTDIRLKLQDESGNSRWVFVVAEKNTTSGDFTSAKAMNLSEYKATGREVDLTYRLSPYASRNAADELDTFISEYAAPGKDVERSYLAEMAGEYKGEISGDDLPGED